MSSRDILGLAAWSDLCHRRGYFATSDTRGIWLWDIDGALLRSVSPGAMVKGLAISSCGTRLAVVSGASVLVLSPFTGDVSRHHVGLGLERFAFLPWGRGAVFRQDSASVVVVGDEMNTSTMLKRPGERGSPHEPTDADALLAAATVLDVAVASGSVAACYGRISSVRWCDREAGES